MHVQVHTLNAGVHARTEDVTIINVIIKTPDRICDWGANDVMLGSDGLRILGDF